MKTNDFIQQCKNSGKFDEKQMYDINKGFEHGFTMEQVKVYAKPEFNWEQMWEIRKGFQNGLTIKQVEVYANPNFNDEQMTQIRYGFENGLSMQQVKLYANLEFKWYQMEQIREFIKENDITNISIKTIKFLIGLNYIKKV